MTDKLPWLGLRSIPGVGIVLGQRLLQQLVRPNLYRTMSEAQGGMRYAFPPYLLLATCRFSLANNLIDIN